MAVYFAIRGTAEGQSVSLLSTFFGDLLYPWPLSGEKGESIAQQLSQAQEELADDILPGYCNNTQAAVCTTLMPADGTIWLTFRSSPKTTDTSSDQPGQYSRRMYCQDAVPGV